MNRQTFVLKLLELDPKIKFMYKLNEKYGGGFSKWKTYQEVIMSYSRLFEVNQKFLRQGIETDEVFELRLDIDTKDENGNKNFNKCLEVAKKICNNLIMSGLNKFTIYETGGAGLHIHLLIDNSEWCNYNSHIVRKVLCKYLNILDYIDTQLLSNKQMLTLEGAVKRDSDTDHVKRVYIGGGTDNDLIFNENYCNEINVPSKEVVSYVIENYYNNDENKVLKSYYNSSNNKVIAPIKTIKQYVKPTPKIILKHLKTFAKYYNINNLKSSNKFYSVVITFLYNATESKEVTKVYFDVLFDTYHCKNNMKCSREQKVEAVVGAIENKNRKKIFFENEYITKNEFYRLYERVEL